MAAPNLLNDYIKSTFCWLPNQKTIKRKPRSFLDIGHFVFLRETLLNHERIWNMIEVSSCPILARKFHIINISEILADDEEDRHLGASLWFVLWAESVGVNYCQLIYKKHCDYQVANQTKRDVKPLAKWRDSVDEILKNVMLITRVKSSPNLHENCIKASNFILEPCVLIQLPWQPILFHQWLLASLVEVLIFERESLELRHWPMPNNIINCASQLLMTVRMLKERIVLGLLMLMQRFSKISRRLDPTLISKEILKPSVPTLQFLISGKAHTVVKSIKKLAWSESKKLSEMDKPSFLTFRAFYMDADLLTFYVTQCYNYDIWNSNDVADPFPETDDRDINAIIKRLNVNKTIVPDFGTIPLVMKPYNLEEKNFYEYLEHNQKTQFMKLTPQKRIELTIQTICDLILEPGRIQTVTPDDVKTKFNAPEVKRHAREIFNREIMKEASHLAIGYTLMYWQAYVTLIGSERENTVIGRVVSLGLEVMEREQIIRLTNACCALFQMCPVAIKMDDKPPLSIPTMLQMLEECKGDGKSYFQVPTCWTSELNLETPAPQQSDGVENIIKSFEQRLGSIIQYGTNYARPFPYWHIIQYVLPGFVATYVKITQRKDRRMQQSDETNYLAFLHNLVRFYETKFGKWIKAQKLPRDKITDRTVIEELRVMNHDLVDRIQILLGFYTNSMDTSEESDCIPGYNLLSDTLTSFPNIFLSNDTNVYDDIHGILQPWVLRSHKFIKHMYRVCLETFQPPVPGVTIFKNKALFEMYFTDAIVSNLIIIFKVAILGDVKEKFVKLTLAIIEGILHRDKWKRTLYKLAFNPDVMSKNQINSFIIENRKLIMELYANLKKFRTVNYGKIKLRTESKLLKDETYLVQEDVQKYIDSADYTLHDELNNIQLDNPIKLPKQRKTCRKCSKVESRRCRLIPCEECVKDKYPDINYFCSTVCQQEWWNEEHMAEHLEFELGLSDFSNLDINN